MLSAPSEIARDCRGLSLGRGASKGHKTKTIKDTCLKESGQREGSKLPLWLQKVLLFMVRIESLLDPVPTTGEGPLLCSCLGRLFMKDRDEDSHDLRIELFPRMGAKFVDRLFE